MRDVPGTINKEGPGSGKKYLKNKLWKRFRKVKKELIFQLSLAFFRSSLKWSIAKFPEERLKRSVFKYLNKLHLMFLVRLRLPGLLTKSKLTNKSPRGDGVINNRMLDRRPRFHSSDH